MTEKIIDSHKNGMPVMLALIAAYCAAIACMVVGGINMDTVGGIVLFVVGIVWVCIGWLPMLGLKVLKPQEALVLTLFGKYIGTLKGEGFYFVNPFCVGVNPAANTKLSQSADVDSGSGKAVLNAALSGANQLSVTTETTGKKMSLKVMTLSNARQKINDCLGNPVEIGIAVMWRVVDTAKAAFNVDNYKEYLSLQCDSALRNIVRIYPYDVAPGIDTTGDGQADEGSLRGSSETVAQRIRYRPRSPTRGLRSSKRASPILPMRPRSRRSCSSASRPRP